MKESEPGEPRCPECAALGLAVERLTVEAHVTAEAVKRLSFPASWCATPRCGVAYFDPWNATVLVTELLHGATWPKDPAGVLCACFRTLPDEIEADAKAGRSDRIKELVRRAQSREQQCEVRAPSGRSCATEARRLFLRASGADSPGAT